MSGDCTVQLYTGAATRIQPHVAAATTAAARVDDSAHLMLVKYHHPTFMCRACVTSRVCEVQYTHACTCMHALTPDSERGREERGREEANAQRRCHQQQGTR